MKRKHKIDPFYRVAHEILQTPNHKVRRGIKIIDKNKPRTAPPPKTEFVFDGVGCMICNEVTTIATSVRGRMLKGLIQQEIEGPTLDPTTGRAVVMTRVFPTYVTGRIHGKCLQGLKMILEPYERRDGTYSTNPVRRDEVEILQERVTPRIQRVVTQGLIEMEDDGERTIDEAEATKHVLHKCGVRTKVTSPYIPSEDEIDIKAYRRFGSHARGGIKNYDREINFDNQKRDPQDRR